MGLVCTEKYPRTHTSFRKPMCTCALHSVFGHVHANPVSLINAHARNERLIFVRCTAQRSVCTSSALISNPSPGPRVPRTVHTDAAGAIVARTQNQPTPGYSVPSTAIVRDLQLGTHAQSCPGTRKAVRNWFTARGGPPTEAVCGYAHGLCKRRSSGLDFGQECHSASGRSGDQQITDLGQGWASNCEHPQDRAVSCRHTVSCQGTRRPGRTGCCDREGGAQKGKKSLPVIQSGRLGQACGQFVTCREARGTGRCRKSRGESIRLMFVNLNPKGRRLPTKLVSPARRWARGPKCKRRLPGGSQCIASDKRPGSRLQAPGLQASDYSLRPGIANKLCTRESRDTSGHTAAHCLMPAPTLWPVNRHRKWHSEPP